MCRSVGRCLKVRRPCSRNLRPCTGTEMLVLSKMNHDLVFPFPVRVLRYVRQFLLRRSAFSMNTHQKTMFMIVITASRSRGRKFTSPSIRPSVIICQCIQLIKEKEFVLRCGSREHILEPMEFKLTSGDSHSSNYIRTAAGNCPKPLLLATTTAGSLL